MYRNYSSINGEVLASNFSQIDFNDKILENFFDNRIIEYGGYEVQETQNETNVQSESTAQSSTDITNSTTNNR